jgi:hypothetical protein
MKDFDRDEHRIEIRAEQNPEVIKSKDPFAQMRLKPGHSLFRMNLMTLKVEKLDLEEYRTKTIALSEAGSIDRKSEIILTDKLHRYEGALNMKSANKKFAKFIEMCLGNDPVKIKQFHEHIQAQLQAEKG